MKSVLAVAAGLFIVVVCEVLLVVVAGVVFDHGTGPVAMAFWCFVSATMGLILAVEAKTKLAPEMPERAFILWLGVTLAVWMLLPLTWGGLSTLQAAGVVGYVPAFIVAMFRAGGAKPRPA